MRAELRVPVAAVRCTFKDNLDALFVDRSERAVGIQQTKALQVHADLKIRQQPSPLLCR